MPGQRAVALLPCVICAVHCRQTLADKHRLLAENERLESVVQQWTQRAKGYIGESTKATAELYKRDQLLAKVGTSNRQASNRTPRLLTPRAWRLQSKKRVEDRKDWLNSYEKGTQANYDVDAVSYEEFVDKELIQFSR